MIYVDYYGHFRGPLRQGSHIQAHLRAEISQKLFLGPYIERIVALLAVTVARNIKNPNFSMKCQ